MALSKPFLGRSALARSLRFDRFPAAGCAHRAVSQAQNYSSVVKSKAQPSYIIESALEPIPSVRNVSVQEIVRSKIGRWGHQTAYECAVTGLKYTHDQAIKLGRNFGTALLQAGLKRGDIVAVALPNCPQYPVVINAFLETGITASLLSPAYTASELQSMIEKSEAKGVITIPDFVPIFKSIQAQTAGKNLKTIISLGPAVDGCHSYNDMVKTSSDGVELFVGPARDTANEVALILWSSGTTGLPKGVMLTHENISAQVLQTASPVLTKYKEGEETLLGLIPFYHIFGEIVMLQVCPFIGAKVATMPKFDPELFLKTIKTFKPSIMHIVPPLVAMIGAHPAIQKEDLSKLHKVVAGGATTPSHHIQALIAKTVMPDFFFQTVYGMTELCGAATIVPRADGNTRTTSVGRPMPGTRVKIVDLESRQVLGPNQPGEICVKGPQVMKGYFNNEEATKSFFDADGFTKTGDVGFFDDQGYLYIVDRLKELIKVKGFQVSPTEIEEVLIKFPKVGDVAVIGIPDDMAGELPRAYIVRRDSSLSEAEVHQFLSDKLASYKQLKGGIEFVQAIPKSPSGKILRKELLKMFESEKQKN